MPKKQLRVGLIGYSFMGRAHSNAFHQVNHFFPSVSYTHLTLPTKA